MVAHISFLLVVFLCSFLFEAPAHSPRAPRPSRTRRLRSRAPRQERPSVDRKPRLPRGSNRMQDGNEDLPQHANLLVADVERMLEAPAPVNSSQDAGISGDAIVGGIDIAGNPSDAGQSNAATSVSVDINGSPVDLQRTKLKPIGSLPRKCDCLRNQTLDVDDIRQLSDSWMDGGTTQNTRGFSNMLWSYGQFIDHDIVGTYPGSQEVVKREYYFQLAHTFPQWSSVHEFVPTAREFEEVQTLNA